MRTKKSKQRSRFCIQYSVTVQYETEWLEAANAREAAQRLMDIVGPCQINAILEKDVKTQKLSRITSGFNMNRGDGGAKNE